MKWLKASEQLPAAEKEVLIRFDDQYFLAVLEKNKQAFRLRNGNSVSVANSEVMWTELIAP
jgi:hypothetical protein